MKRVLSVFMVSLTGIPALLAHPGHGPMESDLMHYLASPAHLAGAVVLVIACAMIGYRVRFMMMQKKTT